MCISTCLFFAISCAELPSLGQNTKDNLTIFDSEGKLGRDDYRGMNDAESLKKPAEGLPGNARTEELNITAGVSEPPVPELAEIIAAPKPPKIGATQLVSLAVSDDVPLKDVLIELARLADVDIEVDAGISGGVSFRAKDRPFNEVIERIADLAGLRYSIKNSVLRVERDTPYIQTYTLDMLNLDRDSNGTIALNSAGGGAAGGVGGAAGGAVAGGAGAGAAAGAGGAAGGASNSSTSNITQSSKSDFWEKFEDSVKRILSYRPVRMTSAATIASQPTPPSGAPLSDAASVIAPEAVPAPTGGGIDPDATRVAPGGPPAAPAAAAPQQPAAIAPSPLPAADNISTEGTFYSLNRQAGTLTVAATERQHEIIRRFLTAIEANASSQVLIEAKIVEVSLNERYQSGINWTRFGNGAVSYTGLFDTVSASTTNAGVTPASFAVLSDRLFRTGVDLSAAVRLLDEFGATRALSSPRLNAMNNQQAVLTFAENLVYFRVRIRVTAAVPGTGGSVGTPAIVEVNSEENRAPVGILLSMLPTINKDTNEVTLSVRPTLTRVTQFVVDPSFPIQIAVALNNLNASSSNADLIEKIRNTDSRVPQIETRELDSILKLKSGQVMVIGGLLEDKVTNNDAGVPGVSEMPFLGNLFKSVTKTNSKKELVIFVRATIVGSNGNATEADKNRYEKFIHEADPLKF